MCLGYQHSRAEARAALTEQQMEEARAQSAKENEAAQKAFADAAKVNADGLDAANRAYADAVANAAPTWAPSRSL